jgi:hypothetical protein
MKAWMVLAGILGVAAILVGARSGGAIAAGRIVVYNADTAEFGEAFAKDVPGRC